MKAPAIPARMSESFRKPVFNQNAAESPKSRPTFGGVVFLRRQTISSFGPFRRKVSAREGINPSCL